MIYCSKCLLVLLLLLHSSHCQRQFVHFSVLNFKFFNFSNVRRRWRASICTATRRECVATVVWVSLTIHDRRTASLILSQLIATSSPYQRNVNATTITLYHCVLRWSSSPSRCWLCDTVIELIFQNLFKRWKNGNIECKQQFWHSATKSNSFSIYGTHCLYAMHT